MPGQRPIRPYSFMVRGFFVRFLLLQPKNNNGDGFLRERIGRGCQRPIRPYIRLATRTGFQLKITYCCTGILSVYTGKCRNRPRQSSVLSSRQHMLAGEQENMHVYFRSFYKSMSRPYSRGGARSFNRPSEYVRYASVIRYYSHSTVHTLQ